MRREYTHTPLEVAEGILSGRYTLTSVYVLVNQIEDLGGERDAALAEVERMRAENARLRAQVAEYFNEPPTHPVEGT